MYTYTMRGNNNGIYYKGKTTINKHPNKQDEKKGKNKSLKEEI